MPLSEFLRLARGKLEVAEQKSANCSTGLSFHDDDLVELVWNNGQLMMQGQSNRGRKSPTFDEIPSPGVRDKGFGNATHLKAGKFTSLQFMDDAAPSVPSADLLNQDNEIEPWLNSSIDESCREAYFSDILPEISGVTGAESSLYSSFAEMDKRNSSGAFGNRHNVPVHTGIDFELQNPSKICSSSAGLFSRYATDHGELSTPLMDSGVSQFNSSSQTSNVFFGGSNRGQTSENAFMNMMPEKQNTGTSGSGSSLFNFTHFSRPVAMYRSNFEKTDVLDASCSPDVKRTGDEEKIHAANSCIPVKSTIVPPSSMRKETPIFNETSLVPKKADLRPSVAKSPVESCPAETSGRLCHEDLLKNDKLPGAGVTKGSTAVEKIAEPLLPASSVCSGNSAEVASIDHMHKRKDRDNEESDSRSEDNEEESLGRKKTAAARGGSGTKRSRAAEVHNLSERRRRDRINEKMRALQELIPNCNKADKASMLDEAIEYLKTLQLQVQVMSMGAGLCMPQMMFPTALPHMHAGHMQHFPSVGGGMGMGMGMGFGMGMIDMNSGAPRFPMYPVPTMQGARFPSPPMYGPSPFQGLAGQNFQVFGHPGQGHPLPIPKTPPLFPSPVQPPVNKAVGSNSLVIGIHSDAPKTSPLLSSDAPMQNKDSQVMPDAGGRSATDQTPSQPEAVNGSFDHPFVARKGDQVPDACGAASINFTSSKDDSSSKEGVD